MKPVADDGEQEWGEEYVEEDLEGEENAGKIIEDEGKWRGSRRSKGRKRRDEKKRRKKKSEQKDTKGHK